MGKNEPSFGILQEAFHVQGQIFLKAAREIGAETAVKPGICGEWSVKDVLAHLSGWNREAVREFGLLPDGELPPLPEDMEIVDQLNAGLVEIYQDFSWEQVLTSFEESLTALEQAAQAVKAQDAAREPRYGVWLRIMAEELENHYKDLCGLG
jgi:hypothetical protein